MIKLATENVGWGSTKIMGAIRGEGAEHGSDGGSPRSIGARSVLGGILFRRTLVSCSSRATA
jgi:hypothetical protein